MADEELDEALDRIEQEAGDISDQLAKARSRGLVRWAIRWAITIGLYIYFWNYVWIRWTLIFTIPLGLVSLYMYTFGYKKAMAKFDELGQQMGELADETD